MDEEATRIIAKEIKDFRGNVEKYMKSAALSLIGLEQKSWGNNSMEIDHCNGRNSVIIDVFRNLAKGEAEKLAKSYKPSKEDILGFKEAFAREYRKQINYSIGEAAKNKANQDVKEYLTLQDLNIEKIIEETLNK